MAIMIGPLGFKLYCIATMAGENNDLRSRLSPIFESFARPLIELLDCLCLGVKPQNAAIFLALLKSSTLQNADRSIAYVVGPTPRMLSNSSRCLAGLG